MGAKTMNKLVGNHPSLEALAEFAEGRSPTPAAIEAHLDTCESCAREVLAGREAIALESLGPDEFRMTPAFEGRARRELLAVVGSKGPLPKSVNALGALGALGLLEGLGGLGFSTAGPDMVLAEGDHPDEIPPHSEKPVAEGEIPGHDAPSHDLEDDVSRMLDHIHDVIGDAASDHPVDTTDQTSFDHDFSADADSTVVPEVDITPVDPHESLDHESSEAADHHNNHDNPLDHSDDDFPG
jgi:hypothetical protein